MIWANLGKSSVRQKVGVMGQNNGTSKTKERKKREGNESHTAKGEKALTKYSAYLKRNVEDSILKLVGKERKNNGAEAIFEGY